MIQAGQALPMGQRGVLKDGQLVRDSRIADLPTYTEIMVATRVEAVKQTLDYRAMAALIGMNVTAREIVYPPGVDAALVETMRQAMVETFQDAEFLGAAEKMLGFQQEFMPGAEAQELARRVLRQSRKIRRPWSISSGSPGRGAKREREAHTCVPGGDWSALDRCSPSCC